MTRTAIACSLYLLLAVAPASAQSRFDVTQAAAAQIDRGEPNPLRFASTRNRQIADIASDATVAIEAALYVARIIRSEHRGRAIACGGSRLLVTGAIVESMKRVVKRPRPNGRDDYSFPSGHTAFAAVMARGWTWQLAFPIGVAVGRQAAGEHWDTDTIFGGIIGSLVRAAVCAGDDGGV